MNIFVYISCITYYCQSNYLIMLNCKAVILSKVYESCYVKYVLNFFTYLKRTNRQSLLK